MPRCPRCKQTYVGAFHMNCPAIVGPVAPASQQAAPDVSGAAEAIAPEATGQARPPAPPGQKSISQREPPRQPASPRPLARAPTAPSPANQPRAATAPMHTAAPPASLSDRGALRGIVTGIGSGQARRSRGRTATSAIVGVSLLVLSLVVLNPCIFVLAIVGIYVLRGSVFRTLFPGGNVPTWSCALYDHERQISDNIRVLEPEGVPPEIGAYVAVDGRRRSTHFEAWAVRRIRDAQGNPTGGDSLVARQVPPALVGYGLLLLGLLAMLWAVGVVVGFQ